MWEGGPVEGLVAVFDDRRWDCAYARVTTEFIYQEFVPRGDRLSEWHELVTVQAVGVTPSVGLADYVEHRRSVVAARFVDGAFDWQMLVRHHDGLIYSWTLENDVAAVDQLELVRVVRGVRAINSLHYAIRAPLEEAAAARAQWLPRLESAVLAWRAPSAGGAPVSIPDEAQEAFQSLLTVRDPGPEITAASISTARRVLSLIERASDPMLWASVHFLLGGYLADSGGDFEDAIAAYRRALEVYSLEAAPELWARAMKRLGEAFAARPDGDPAANAAHAAAAFGQALRVVARGTKEWANTTLALADAERALETKEDLYVQVLDAFADDPGFACDVDADLAADLAERASAGIQQIDRMRAGEVIVPPGFDERKTRGAAAYLRPLITSGRLMLQNKFRDPSALVVQYEREPDQMTLEGVLNRVLAPHFDFLAIGGRPEGYGPSRILMTPGIDWKDVFKIFFEDSALAPILVLIVPHRSDGVHWEAKQLIERRALDKTLFVMPPTSERFNAAAMWTDGRLLLADHGLQLPPYDPAGMFVRLHPNGAVAESWPFEIVWSNTLVERIDHLLPQA
jgi:tetratricopeptide (TPR) repeat protein